MKLRLGPNLELPEESITRTFGILATRGAGKSNTGAVMAEEMFAAGLPFVVIDPVGSWFGLRSSADGTGHGLPIPIFGGKHGDVPLERSAGVLLADLIISKRLTCVLDLSEFESENAKKQFLLDFARRLYSKNENPLHIFLEEADDYISQRPMRDEAQLLRAWENIVRRGRSRGLGMTIISQRSASVNKSVLTQIETLFAMRTMGPQDIEAIKGWVQYHQIGNEVVSSLSGLADGDAWVWSPNFLKRMDRCSIRRRRTFDSGATPKNFTGLHARPGATLADVDLVDIQKQMAATIERVKADDPKELRKQIATLTAELKKADASRNLQKPAEPKIVEISVLTDADRSLLEACSSGVTSLAAKSEAVLGLFNALMKEVSSKGRPLKDELGRQMGATFPVVSTAVPGSMKAKVSDQHRDHRANGAGTLSKAELRLLTVLAQYPSGKELKSLAHLAGYTVNGHFNNTLGSLRSRGLAQAGNPVVITNLGMDTLGDDFEPLPAGEALRQYWLNKVGGSERRILNVLINLYPEGATPGGLALASGYTVNGHFNNMLGSLRTAGIVERGVPIKASSTLFE